MDQRPGEIAAAGGLGGRGLRPARGEGDIADGAEVARHHRGRDLAAGGEPAIERDRGAAVVLATGGRGQLFFASSIICS